MNGFERTRRALRFEKPDRVPLWMADEVFDMSNDLGAEGSRTFTPLPEETLREMVPGFAGTLRQSEWGHILGKLDTDLSTTETVRSILDDEWTGLDGYAYPDLDAPYRYEVARARIAARAGSGVYELAWFGSFYFGTLYHVRTMEDLLVDLGLYQDELTAFCAGLEPVFHRCLERWAEVGAHGVLLGEDLGLQDRLIMAPGTWREIFKPFYARFVEKAHALGLDVLLHSCGYDREILDDFVEVGLDALQFDQVRVYDFDDLAANVAGRIAFFCPVDIQAVMPLGEPDRIRREAKAMIETLGTADGGFLAKDYPTWNDVGVSPEAAACMREAFLAYGRYRDAE